MASAGLSSRYENPADLRIGRSPTLLSRPGGRCRVDRDARTLRRFQRVVPKGLTLASNPLDGVSHRRTASVYSPQPMNKLRLLTSVTAICIATLLIAIATAKALTQEQEIAKSKCGLKFVTCINSTCAKYKGDDQMQMRCYERCVRMYTECLENAGIPPNIGAHPAPAH
jgi:hypothetical protein